MRYSSWDTKWNWQFFFVILGNFLSFYHSNNLKHQNSEKLKKKTLGDVTILHMCTINDNHIMYSSKGTECNRQNFVILDNCLPFYPPNNPKNQNFEKMKKISGDIIILQMCSINDNHDVWFPRYEAWWTEIFVIWTILCPFTPLTTWKIKILKKWNTCLEILSFYTNVPKIMIMCYTVPEIWYVMDVTVIFHFGLICALLPPKSPKDIILQTCTKNYD